MGSHRFDGCPLWAKSVKLSPAGNILPPVVWPWRLHRLPSPRWRYVSGHATSELNGFRTCAGLLSSCGSSPVRRNSQLCSRCPQQKRLRAVVEIARAHAQPRSPPRPSIWPIGTDTAANPVARPAGGRWAEAVGASGRRAVGRPPLPVGARIQRNDAVSRPRHLPFSAPAQRVRRGAGGRGARSVQASRTHCLGARHPTDLPVLQFACLYAPVRQVRILTAERRPGRRATPATLEGPRGSPPAPRTAPARPGGIIG